MSAVAEETKQEFAFQAEIKQLLHLLAHSLYQSKEIAIRELVSNASDALDKMRLAGLTQPDHRIDDALEIHLETDSSAKTLTIADNGIGMTRDELMRNLGTIAHSGSLEFLRKLPADNKGAASLIGQFGVGFYSAFMLADKVTVRTRSYADPQGWEWESDGTGTYAIAPIEDASLPRGTRVILHLKDDAKEFLDAWRIKSVIRKYSSFIPHPIKMGEEWLNDQRPIWVEPKNQVTEEQHEKFYQHLAHRHDEKPLWHLHLSFDSPIQFHAVLYCPRTNHELLGLGKAEHGMHLCAKRVLVQNDNQDLAPGYLRFLYGLVDSEDLPLNVSRETLQDSSIIRRIQTILVKHVLDKLQKLADEDARAYLTFHRQFGPTLKEGISTDIPNRERIAKLLRFASSHALDPESPTSLDDYIQRAPEDQTQIYFLGGPDLNSVQKNPHVEIYRKRGLEVLYLTDPVDEFVMTTLGKYNGKPLVSIDSSEAELPASKSDESETPETEAAKESGGFQKVLALFREALGDRVQDVRESKRLADSPCCLVNPDGGLTIQMQRLIKMADRNFEFTKRILEVNPRSSLIQRFCALSVNPGHDAFIKDCARQLWANAVILEGTLPDPEEMVGRIQDLMERAAKSQSPIIV